jgi:Tol biopolymer transport system component
LTVFVPASRAVTGGSSAFIETVTANAPETIWRCPDDNFCGQVVSFDWAPDGRRVAFTLDEIGGTSSYVGLHVVDVVTGRDRHVPSGAPPRVGIGARMRDYIRRMLDRVGCWPAVELDWSPDGTRLAYRCGKGNDTNLIGWQGRPHINILELNGSGHTTIPTSGSAYWPSWSPTGTRIAYSTKLGPDTESRIFTVALDGSNRQQIAAGAAAPAWSPDGRTIAYQTRCGVRLVTPTGHDVTPRRGAMSCRGAIGLSGPPAWSPDGKKLAIETGSGIYVIDVRSGDLRIVSHRATRTWYGELPGRPSWQPVP